MLDDHRLRRNRLNRFVDFRPGRIGQEKPRAVSRRDVANVDYRLAGSSTLGEKPSGVSGGGAHSGERVAAAGEVVVLDIDQYQCVFHDSNMRRFGEANKLS